MPAYLQLVSRGGAQLQGWNAGKGWAGWIPIVSYSLGIRQPHAVQHGSQGAAPDPTSDIHEIHLATRMADIDVSTLMRWSTEGEPTTAKLDVLPTSGDEGRQWLMTGAFVAAVSIAGEFVSFSLNFEKLEFLFLLKR